jgi:hypothetical protein
MHVVPLSDAGPEERFEGESSGAAKSKKKDTRGLPSGLKDRRMRVPDGCKGAIPGFMEVVEDNSYGGSNT